MISCDLMPRQVYNLTFLLIWWARYTWIPRKITRWKRYMYIFVCDGDRAHCLWSTCIGSSSCAISHCLRYLFFFCLCRNPKRAHHIAVVPGAVWSIIYVVVVSPLNLWLPDIVSASMQALIEMSYYFIAPNQVISKSAFVCDAWAIQEAAGSTVSIWHCLDDMNLRLLEAQCVQFFYAFKKKKGKQKKKSIW